MEASELRLKICKALVLIIACMCVFFGVAAAAQDLPPVQEPPEALRHCDPATPPQYQPAPVPDKIADILKGRKRYRLVIGAGEYMDDPEHNNRLFVENTAIRVDSRLNELGYEALPGSKGAKPYLIGKNVTRDAINAALNDMAKATQGGDFGIIYYAGHGTIASNGSDLSLGLYNEPIAPDQGYRFSDIIGIMSTAIYHSSVKQIPHLFIILDTCFSGTVAQPDEVGIVTGDGVQRLVLISGSGPLIPPQVSILTATSAGSNSSAYELNGTGLSAFGYYFARALKEDWACSDALARDGVLTLEEMEQYLAESLDRASKMGALTQAMSPQMLARDKNSLLAYRSDKYVEPGFRKLIYSVLITPEANQPVTAVLPGEVQTMCSDSKIGCTVYVSTDYANSDLTLGIRNTGIKGLAPPPLRKQTIKLADLIKGPMTIMGVKLEVNQSTTGLQ
jgi:Caspase domain